MERRFSAGSSSSDGCSRFIGARSQLLRRILRQEITPAEAELLQRRYGGAQGGERHIHRYTFILENKLMLKTVAGIPREPAM